MCPQDKSGVITVRESKLSWIRNFEGLLEKNERPKEFLMRNQSNFTFTSIKKSNIMLKTTPQNFKVKFINKLDSMECCVDLLQQLGKFDSWETHGYIIVINFFCLVLVDFVLLLNLSLLLSSNFTSLKAYFTYQY